MQALVLESQGRLAVDADHAVPDAPDDRPAALVRVAACGVCGSDLPRAFDGKAYHYPLVMGHEFSGTVEEPVPGGSFKAGDRVAVFPLIPKDAETDPACQVGDHAQAAGYDYFGSRRDGGFAEYVRAPEWNLIAVPDDVPLLHAAMTEPAAVALHGVRRLSVQVGDDAAVFGGGPIGNLVAQWLRVAGCGRVFLVDVDPEKLALAERMGMVPVDGRGDAVATIKAATGGEGVQRSVEAVGLPATFVQAVRVASRAGEVLFMGNISGEFRLGPDDFSSILRRELTIHGTWNSKVAPRGTDDWTTVLKQMRPGAAAPLSLDPMITDRLPLAEGPRVFGDLRERRGLHNKVLFDISPADTGAPA